MQTQREEVENTFYAAQNALNACTDKNFEAPLKFRVEEAKKSLYEWYRKNPVPVNEIGLYTHAEVYNPYFIAVWEHLAELGQVDSWRSSQSERLYCEYLDAGCPELVYSFIQGNAGKTKVFVLIRTATDTIAGVYSTEEKALKVAAESEAWCFNIEEHWIDE